LTGVSTGEFRNPTERVSQGRKRDWGRARWSSRPDWPRSWRQSRDGQSDPSRKRRHGEL